MIGNRLPENKVVKLNHTIHHLILKKLTAMLGLLFEMYTTEG